MIDEPRQAPDESMDLSRLAALWRGDDRRRIRRGGGRRHARDRLAGRSAPRTTPADAEAKARAAVERARRGTASRRRPDRWRGSSSPRRTSRRARRRSRIGLAAALAADGADRADLQEGAGLYRPDVARARERPRLLQPRLQHADAAPKSLSTFARNARGADIALSKATRACTTASTSKAAIRARRWRSSSRAPVVLVVDATGMARGVAPLVQGYAAFDRERADRRRHPQQGRLGAADRQAAQRARALSPTFPCSARSAATRASPCASATSA